MTDTDITKFIIGFLIGGFGFIIIEIIIRCIIRYIKKMSKKEMAFLDMLKRLNNLADELIDDMINTPDEEILFHKIISTSKTDVHSKHYDIEEDKIYE